VVRVESREPRNWGVVGNRRLEQARNCLCFVVGKGKAGTVLEGVGRKEGIRFPVPLGSVNDLLGNWKCPRLVHHSNRSNSNRVARIDPREAGRGGSNQRYGRWSFRYKEMGRDFGRLIRAFVDLPYGQESEGPLFGVLRISIRSSPLFFLLMSGD